jgi:hypothetical protein
MPVEVDAGGKATVGGEGMVPTVVDDHRQRVVVPLLVVGQPVGEMGSIPLHELPSDRRLVATVLDGEASPLFPSMHPIVIRVDAAMLLRGPAAAWGALDGLVLDRGTFDLFTHGQVSDFLSAGTVLAVRSAERPGGEWPWRAEGKGYWALSAAAGGPAGAELNEAAYGPTFSWSGDWPMGFRRLGMVAAGVFVLLVFLAALLPGGWRIAVISGLSLSAMALLVWWRSAHAPLLQRNGVIVCQDPSTICRDHWFYQTAPDGRPAAFVWKEWAIPVFASLEQMRSMNMRLRCDGAGRPIGFEYHLPARARIAFMSRRVDPAAAWAVPQPARRTPLRDMAQRLYLRPDLWYGGRRSPDRIAGQASPADGANWPTVIVRRSLESTPNDAQKPHSE